MHSIKQYKLQVVHLPSDILNNFSKKIIPKVKHILLQFEEKGITWDYKGVLSLPQLSSNSHIEIVNGIEIIKYLIYPKFFKIKQPENFLIVQSLLKVSLPQTSTPIKWIYL